MGKKGGGEAPTPPDPVATAQAQGTMNRETAVAQANLNRIDQYTPQGSITYSQIGTNADGTPQYRQDMQYSPATQAQYDQQMALSGQLGGIAQQGMSAVSNTMAHPLNYDNLTPAVTGINGDFSTRSNVSPHPVQTSLGPQGEIKTGVEPSGSIQTSMAPSGPVQTSVSPSGAIANAFASGGPVQTGVADAGGIRKNTTYAGGSKDFGSNVRDVANSVYGQATSRLDPQFQQGASDLASKLSAQGISNNSDAYRREMDNFARAKNDAYNQANYSAIQAGGAEQSRLFGMSLASDQFANQSQAQQYGQNLSSQQANNNAQGQIFGQNQAQAQFGNSAQAQQYQQNANNMTMANAAQGQIFGQNANTMSMNNQAQAQNYSQNANNFQLSNAAQQQAYQQAMGSGTFANQAQDQAFQQDVSSAGLYNTARNQDYNTQLSQANFSNTARQNQAQEQAYLYNQPLNTVASLMGTAGPLQGPNFSSVPQVGVAAPDYQGLVQSNYQNALNQYNLQQQASGGFLGNLFGGLGSIGGALIMSDRRIKENIKRVGKLANGIPTYTYRYIGDTLNVIRFGVMAQDVQKVIPKAVVSNDNGTLMVNYGKVW